MSDIVDQKAVKQGCLHGERKVLGLLVMEALVVLQEGGQI